MGDLPEKLIETLFSFRMEDEEKAKKKRVDPSLSSPRWNGQQRQV